MKWTSCTNVTEQTEWTSARARVCGVNVLPCVRPLERSLARLYISIHFFFFFFFHCVFRIYIGGRCLLPAALWVAPKNTSKAIRSSRRSVATNVYRYTQAYLRSCHVREQRWRSTFDVSLRDRISDRATKIPTEHGAVKVKLIKNKKRKYLNEIQSKLLHTHIHGRAVRWRHVCAGRFACVRTNELATTACVCVFVLDVARRLATGAHTFMLTQSFLNELSTLHTLCALCGVHLNSS